MIVLTSLGGRRLTVRPRFIAGVKEMEPDPEFGAVCRVHLSQRSVYVVRGSFDEITKQLGFQADSQASEPQPDQESSTS
ncbi:MAG: hypothetical protein A3E78_11740 [Alphaproteobacteria bacterium RIFCSPHIGHO2_12_FULL_63_12]|nr:MAG: hypothetical protein A3E78_11740 [Alphaproteobacteria bacterium RIFCSPHIGHO2_12_FULL_63_12]